MQIVDNKVLVLRTKHPHKYSVIPRSKNLGEVERGIHEVAVFWGLDEVRVLKNMGVRNPPSPILRDYQWPGKYKPFKHQIETASFLTMHTQAFVFSEPGTGKTISALWAADYLMRKGKVRRCLILCPLSIMQAAWLADISKSVVHRTAAIAYHSRADRRKEIVNGDYEFIICNYDGLPLIADTIEKNGKFDLIIGDEANAWKNVSTNRWKTLNKLIKQHTYVWLMTGTPAAQSPEDAYGLAKLINPSGVPRFSSAWRDKVMRQITRFKWVPKDTAYDEVYKALQPAIRFTKEQCLDLPPVVTVVREPELTPQQIKYYRMLKSQMLVQAAGETISAVNAAASVNKLLQISAGAAYTDNSEVVEFNCAPRLNVLLEVLQETSRKVLVFAPYRHSIDTIATFLDKEKIPSAKIHGDVSASKRALIFNEFQTNENPRVLIIQPQAASHGVTLTAADTIVFWGPVMSVETYLQCIARADRVGQTGNKVTVVHIQASDIERRMFKQLSNRVEDHNTLIELYKEELAGTKIEV
jgi:SNF2 family DNA or RNA helicase